MSDEDIRWGIGREGLIGQALRSAPDHNGKGFTRCKPVLFLGLRIIAVNRNNRIALWIPLSEPGTAHGVGIGVEEADPVVRAQWLPINTAKQVIGHNYTMVVPRHRNGPGCAGSRDEDAVELAQTIQREAVGVRNDIINRCKRALSIQGVLCQ